MPRFRESTEFAPGLNGRTLGRIAEPRPWLAEAACADHDADLWFPPDGALGRSIAAQAKAICHVCPVRLDCLAGAVARYEEFGIYGGTSERERRELRRQVADGSDEEQDLDVDETRGRLASLLEGEDTHGSVARWAAGCRCHACRFAGGLEREDRKYRAQEAS